MKGDLALSWSQGVASSRKDEEIASTAEILSLVMLCFDAGADAQQWGWRRGSDRTRISEGPGGRGCRDTGINFGIRSHG